MNWRERQEEFAARHSGETQGIGQDNRPIDELASEILGVTEKDMKEIENIVALMMKRRIARAKEARPESIGGERPRIQSPDRSGRISDDRLTPPLGRGKYRRWG